MTTNSRNSNINQDESLTVNNHSALFETLSGNTVLDVLTDAIIIIDETGIIVWCNQETISMTGYLTEELVGQKIEVLLPDRYKNKHVSNRASFFSKPVKRSMGLGLDLYASRKDGVEFPCDVGLSPLQIKDGLYIVCNLRDISDQIQLREHRNEIRQLMSDVLDSLPQHIAILDERGVIISVNKAWRKFSDINGLGNSDYSIGMNYLNICDQAVGECSEEAKTIAKGIRDIMAGVHPEVRVEYPCHSPDEKRWFQCRISRIKTKNIYNIILAHENITEIKLEHEALIQSEKKFRIAAKSVSDLIYVADANNDVLEWIGDIDDVLGYEQNEFPRTITANVESVHPDDIEYLKKSIQHVLDTGTKFNTEYRIRCKDGSYRYWLDNADWLDYGARLAVGSIKDITEMKEKDQQLQEANTEADINRERLAHLIRVQTMGEMASGIAHEINQPLAAIDSYAQACQRHLLSETYSVEKIRELLEKVSGQSQRAGIIVSKIRAMMQKQALNAVKLDLNDLIIEVSKIAEIEAKLNNCSFVFMLDTCSPFVVGDEIQIQQVILNFIRNGIEAMNEDKSCQDKTIILKTSIIDNDEVEVSISDRGPGIDESDMQSIFEAFHTTKKDGLGMGLSICQNIINAHGGTIGCTNLEEGGARFYFTIPMDMNNEN
jgi:two-component system, LuxR family, sensor kinase FixL